VETALGLATRRDAYRKGQAVMATIVHSFSVMPGNAGAGQNFVLATPGRYSVEMSPPGSVVGLEWLASADPVRWVKWQPFNTDDGQIYVTAKAAPQTFRVIYGDGGSTVEIYFEEGT
jgi:hypothetical protein